MTFSAALFAASASPVPVAPVGPYASQPRLLPFPNPASRQTNWCWAAIAASVAGCYGVAPSQCSIATAVLGATTSCCTDPVACNCVHDFEPALVHVGHHLRTDTVNPAFADIEAEVVGCGQPVPFRVVWTGLGGHIMAVYGTGADAAGNDFLCLADPAGMSHPTDVNYLAMDRYRHGLQWTHTYWTKP